MADMNEMTLRDSAARAFIQIYQMNGRLILRSTTKSVIDPSPAQMRARISFAEIAKKAKGKKMTGDLPPVCDIVKDELKGKRYAGHRVRKPEWQKELEWTAKQMEPIESEEMLKKIKYVRAVLLGEVDPTPLVSGI